MFLFATARKGEAFWQASRFHGLLEGFVDTAAKSLAARFLGGDPTARLASRLASSDIITSLREPGRKIEQSRQALIDGTRAFAEGSIAAAILRHLACPEGWQLAGLSRAGLAFLAGLFLVFASLGALSLKTGLLLTLSIVLLFFLSRSPVTIAEIWADSLPGRLFRSILPEELVPRDDHYPVAPPLKGAGAAAMYLLLFALGAVLALLSIKWQNLLVLALPAVLLAPALLFLRPELGLLGLIGYSVVDWWMRMKPNLLTSVWDDLLLASLAAALIGQWVTKRDFRWRIHPTFFALTAFISLLLFLFLIDSTYPRLSVPLDGLRVIVQHMLWFYIAVQLVKTPRQAALLLILFTLVGTAIAAFGVYQFIVKAPMPENWVDQAELGSITTRAFSIVGSPNILGSLLVLTTPIALGLAYRGKTIQRLFYLACAALMGASMLFSFSRGAWLAIAAAIILFGILQDRRLIALLIIGAILLPIASPAAADRVSYLLSPEYFKKSAQDGRLERWDLALEKVAQRPLTGIGLGRYGGAAAENNKEYLPHRTLYTDNYYMKTAAETGLLGLFAFIALMVSVLRTAFGTAIHSPPPRRALAIGVACGLFGVVLHNAVENVFEVPLMVTSFWLCAALLWELRSNTQALTTKSLDT
ncbi:O-antigen ligase family protein [Heliomicrobium modesticaldum]|uniref:O-antigen ligase family protein n=1 Tax=Heliomicrobium modesticaldum TaxID=35701 RepID=UPI0002EB20C5|nr:O-antigen ligase family protein [Heliomicrobium modesticaldum]